MEQSEVIKRVNATLSDGFEIPPEKLRPDASLFEELGLDSLDAIDMLVYLEENFDVKVQGEIFKQVRTLEDVYRVVGELANKSEPRANQ
jgi:acyl carrier protein